MITAIAGKWRSAGAWVLLTLGCGLGVPVVRALIIAPGDVEPDLDPAFTIQALRGVAVAVVLWVRPTRRWKLLASPYKNNVFLIGFAVLNR